VAAFWHYLPEATIREPEIDTIVKLCRYARAALLVVFEWDISLTAQSIVHMDHGDLSLDQGPASHGQQGTLTCKHAGY
jgi:hypothetical protein